MPLADITHKVFMDVRVARTDGSTYVRDDLPDTFDNRVLFQRLQFGLYGNTSPACVEQFIRYIVGRPSSSTKTSVVDDESSSYDVDNPYPSYSRSTFPSFDQQTGLLMGGNIASLKLKDVNGSPALAYGSRVLPATLWIDSSKSSNNPNKSNNQKISHTTKGLLTHKNLDVLPNFGITTRSQPSLDATHTVFGCVLWDDETLRFFRDLEDLPTYSVERPTGYDDFGTGGVATNVFNAQREFFRGAAQTFGDDRVSKLYNGKLMRRMEVLRVGML
jgi:cyclophilin family peptidyl-prolyl cis-trans isomerase